MSGTPKQVNIEITADGLEAMKGANYKLCFAKKVNGVYTIVWQSYTEYLASNQFSWTPEYQLFGTNTFVQGVTVKAETNIVSIGLGEQSTLDTAGELSAASSGGPSTSITMNNQYGSIHPGVNEASTGLDGKTSITPIYVAKDIITTGTDTLTPKDIVMVWFEQNVETSTMISDAVSMQVEVDLTQVNSATRLFDGANWSTP